MALDVETEIPAKLRTFARQVSQDGGLDVARVAFNAAERVITTVIDAEPFAREPRDRVYTAERDALTDWPNTGQPIEFRLFNLREYEPASARAGLLQQAQGEVFLYSCAE